MLLPYTAANGALTNAQFLRDQVEREVKCRF